MRSDGPWPLWWQTRWDQESFKPPQSRLFSFLWKKQLFWKSLMRKIFRLRCFIWRLHRELKREKRTFLDELETVAVLLHLFPALVSLHLFCRDVVPPAGGECGWKLAQMTLVVEIFWSLPKCCRSYESSAVDSSVMWPVGWHSVAVKRNRIKVELIFHLSFQVFPGVSRCWGVLLQMF